MTPTSETTAPDEMALPTTKTIHRGRVTFHRPVIRQVVDLFPVKFGKTLWAGAEETRTRKPAMRAAVSAFIEGEHTSTETEETENS